VTSPLKYVVINRDWLNELNKRNLHQGGGAGWNKSWSDDRNDGWQLYKGKGKNQSSTISKP